MNDQTDQSDRSAAPLEANLRMPLGSLTLLTLLAVVAAAPSQLSVTFADLRPAEARSEFVAMRSWSIALARAVRELSDAGRVAPTAIAVPTERVQQARLEFEVREIAIVAIPPRLLRDALLSLPPPAA